MARRDCADNDGEDDEGGEDNDDAEEDAATLGLERGLFGGERGVGNYVGIGQMGEAHGLMRV